MIRLLLGTHEKSHVQLTDEEAVRLRDHLIARYPLPIPQPLSGVAAAALAVEAARRKP